MVVPLARPACAGRDPVLFEEPEFYDRGLAYCDSCDVRVWCLQTVDPRRAPAWHGVAGGAAWSNGRVVTRVRQPDWLIEAYLGGFC